MQSEIGSTALVTKTSGKIQPFFFLNVAFADIVYCILYFPQLIYAVALYLEYDLGDSSSACKFFVLGTQTLACISGWSIALTAVSAAFPKIRYDIKKYQSFFDTPVIFIRDQNVKIKISYLSMVFSAL